MNRLQKELGPEQAAVMNGAAHLLGAPQPPPFAVVFAPRYPGAWAPGLRSVVRAVSERCNIITAEVDNSLLTKSFNTCLCMGLNIARKDPKVKYFAMLHADIVPQDFWLDPLIDSLEATGADLASAVVPIKDGRGLTSTAIDDPDEPFEEQCRLTMRQIEKLPVDFTAADAGYPDRALLINTGCWIVKVRPWVRRFALEGGFGIRDRIFECQNGELVAQSESEDWRFSRWMAANGIRYVATRRVMLQHFGHGAFPNQGAWGECEVDPDNTDELKALRRADMKMPEPATVGAA